MLHWPPPMSEHDKHLMDFASDARRLIREGAEMLPNGGHSWRLIYKSRCAAALDALMSELLRNDDPRLLDKGNLGDLL